MKNVLVLNATYEPLSVIETNRAVTLLLMDKAVALEDTGELFTSSDVIVPVPSVILLNYKVNAPHKTIVPFSRKALFDRDQHTCQYCGIQGSREVALEVEHVIPRSRGGRNAWENVTSACRKCNGRKANRTPQEAGMVLARKPFAPTRRAMIALRGNPSWERYLVA